MSKKKTIKLERIIPNPNNPRKISKEDFQKLQNSIRDFPKMMRLRPMVVESRENMVLLGGNQRREAMVKLGYTEVPEDWIAYADDFTEEERKRFIITDNNSFGEWDWKMLEDGYDLVDLEEWATKIPMDKLVDNMDEEEDVIEFEQSLQIQPPKEYILIMADPNSEEWEEIKQRLKLRIVRRGGYKKGSAFDATSLERVLEWDDFKKRYDEQ